MSLPSESRLYKPNMAWATAHEISIHSLLDDQMILCVVCVTFSKNPDHENKIT